MFPTKALAQDQRTSLKIMLAAAFGPEAEAMAEVRLQCHVITHSC
jgi:tagatose-1,6-bisphosphate aldolase